MADEFLQKLLIAFDIDQQALAQAVSKHQAFVDELKKQAEIYLKGHQADQEEAAKKDDQINEKAVRAYVEGNKAKLDAEIKRLETLREEIKKYYKEESDEAKNAYKKIQEDIHRLKEAKDKTMGPEGLSQIKEGFAGIEGAVTNILKVFAPAIAAGFGVYEIVNNLKKAADEIRAINFEVTKMQYLSGDVSQQFGGQLAMGIEKMKWLGMKPEETAKMVNTMIQGGLSTDFIGRMQEAGGIAGTPKGVSGMEAAAGLGVTTGIGAQGVVQAMSDLKRYIGTPESELMGSVKALADSLGSTKVPMKEYVEGVMGLVRTNARYGVGLDESIDLMKAFGEEVHHGKMTMQELTNIQVGIAKISEGSAAYLARQIIEKGPGSLQKELEGVDDAFAQSAIVRDIAQGGRGKEKREDLFRAAISDAEREARKIVGGERFEEMAPRDRESVLAAMFQKMPVIKEAGLGELKLEQIKPLIEYAEKDKTVFNQKIQELVDAASGEESMQQAIVNGMKAIQDSFGPGQWFQLGWESFWRGAMIQLQYAFTYLPGAGGAEARARMEKSPYFQQELQRATEIEKRIAEVGYGGLSLREQTEYSSFADVTRTMAKEKVLSQEDEETLKKRYLRGEGVKATELVASSVAQMLPGAGLLTPSKRPRTEQDFEREVSAYEKLLSQPGGPSMGAIAVTPQVIQQAAQQRFDKEQQAMLHPEIPHAPPRVADETVARVAASIGKSPAVPSGGAGKALTAPMPYDEKSTERVSGLGLAAQVILSIAGINIYGEPTSKKIDEKFEELKAEVKRKADEAYNAKKHGSTP